MEWSLLVDPSRANSFAFVFSYEENYLGGSPYFNGAFFKAFRQCLRSNILAWCKDQEPYMPTDRGVMQNKAFFKETQASWIQVGAYDSETSTEDHTALNLWSDLATSRRGA